MQDFPSKEKNGRWACCREEAKGELSKNKKGKIYIFKKDSMPNTSQCRVQ